VIVVLLCFGSTRFELRDLSLLGKLSITGALIIFRFSIQMKLTFFCLGMPQIVILLSMPPL
jgi:hypothetical protein